MRSTVGAERAERIGHEVGDAVDAVGRVRAAVDVHERLELVEEARQARLDDAPQRGGIGHGGQYTHAPCRRRPRRRRDPRSSSSSSACWTGRTASSPVLRSSSSSPRREPGRAAARRRAAAQAVRRLQRLRWACPSRGSRPATRSTGCAPRSPSRGAGATISQAIGASAARAGARAVERPRELAGLRAVALGPLPHLARPRIPIVAVTGTNGKSTTTRLIAHICIAAPAARWG